MRLDSYQIVFRIKYNPNTEFGTEGHLDNPMEAIEEHLKNSFNNHEIELVEISMRPEHHPEPAAVEPNPAPVILTKRKTK